MPLPYLVLDAMERALHTLLTIWLLYGASELLSAARNPRRDAIILAILAPLLIAALFEGLFLLTLTASLFIVRRCYLYAMLLLVLGAIPVALIGIPSILHGGWILPNSVMLKGNWPSADLLASAVHLSVSAITNLGSSMALCLIAALALVALFFSADRSNPWRPASVRLALFLGILFGHLAFAQVGNPFRYEAYLVVSGIYVLASCSKEPWCEALIVRVRYLWHRSAAATAIVMLMVSLPLVGRGIDGMFRAHRTTVSSSSTRWRDSRGDSIAARRWY